MNELSIDAREEARLKALSEYGPLENAGIKELDQIVNLASQQFNTPVCLVSIVQSDRVYFKSRVGLDICDAPREISLCSHAINEPEIFIVPDASQDQRFEENPQVTKNNGVRFYAGVPLRTAEGHPIGVFCIIDNKPRYDFSHSHQETLKAFANLVMQQLELYKSEQSQTQLIESENRFSLLVSRIKDYAIYMLNPDGIVTNWNLGAERFKGYKPEEIIGKHFECFYTEEDRAISRPQRALETVLTEGRFEDIGWRVRKDGSRFWANVVIDPIHNDAGHLVGFAKITRDISEQQKHQEQLKFLAYHDFLTSLPNRLNVKTHLDDLLSSGKPVAVVLLDMRDFSHFSDTVGHETGDAVLKEVAVRLRRSSPENAIIGRLGNDEFAILMPGVGDPTLAANHAIMISNTLKSPFRHEGEEFEMDLDMGLAMGPQHGDNAQDLLGNADLALRRSKKELSDQFRLYEPMFRKVVVGRRNFQHDLRNAIHNGQLKLFYQPQVSLKDGKIVGAEALVRWDHPDRGLLSPASFLPLLEHTTLEPILGNWIIEKAAAHAKLIRDKGHKTYQVGVNLFSSQLRSNEILAAINNAVQKYQITPDALEIEITENIILSNNKSAMAILNKLREIGVGVAFDDYGTGYASLSLLKSYPLTCLKVDRSFVKHICENKKDMTLIKVIIYLANKFDLKLIAEGIETKEQARELKKLGCDQAQGYLFGRPTREEEISKLLESQKLSLETSHDQTAIDSIKRHAG